MRDCCDFSPVYRLFMLVTWPSQPREVIIMNKRSSGLPADTVYIYIYIYIYKWMKVFPQILSFENVDKRKLTCY